MMTTKTAAQQWGVSQKTVQKYCREGFVSGAMKLRQWQIPTQARPPLYLSPKRLHTFEQRTIAILKALEQHKTIPAAKLAPDSTQVQAHFHQLQHYGLVIPIIPSSGTNDWFTNHQLTLKGSDYLKNHRHRHLTIELAMTINPSEQTLTTAVKVSV